jgi:hypothetical protein
VGQAQPSGLQGAFLKLQRAEHHRKRLQEEVEAFFRHDPAPVVTQKETASANRSRYGLRWATDPPPRWSTIAGDCLQNMRNALDHIAWSCALRSNPSPPRNVGFRVAHSKQEWDLWIAGKAGRKTQNSVGADAWKVMTDLQPHTRGITDFHGDPLWMLSELARSDRHQALHFVAVAETATRFSVRELSQVGNVIDPNEPTVSPYPGDPTIPCLMTPPVKAEGDDSTISTGDAKVTTYNYVAFVLCFEPPHGFPSLTVPMAASAPTLRTIQS